MNESIRNRPVIVFRHTDANGNPKPIFQENKLFTWLMQHGILSPRAWKIPYLLGRWQYTKEIEQ